MDFDRNYRTHHSSTRDHGATGIFSSPLPFALALLGGGAAIFCLWYFFYAGSHGSSNQPIPVIKAEAGPMKARPDSASQPEVPHQDKLVYSRVNPAEQNSNVERLLPPTEEPMEVVVDEVPTTPAAADSFPSPQAAAEDKSEFRVEPRETQAEPSLDKLAGKIERPEVSKETTVTVDQVEGTTAAPAKANEAEDHEVIKVKAAVAEKSEASEKPVAVPVKTTPAAAKNLQSGYRIQLASMKSPEYAKKEWVRLQGEHKQVLSGLTPTYSRVDLGAKKGIFYRVQAGDFANKAEAQKVCSKLKTKNGNAGCMIVKF